MLEIFLFSLSPLVGLIPLDRLLGKKTVIVSVLIFVLISAVFIYPVLFTDYSYTDKTLDTVVKTMAFASIGLLIGVWNPIDRKSLIIGFGAVTLILTNALGGLYKFGTSVLSGESKFINAWTINEYKVIAYSRLGLAGPGITEYTLYKTKMNGLLIRRIGRTTENRNEICPISFDDENLIGRQTIYYFDKCKTTIKKENKL